MSFSIKARLKSFGYAFSGISHLVRHEHNAWIHLLATLVVIAAGGYFSLSATDWALVVFAITLVWLAEGMNTALELLANAVTQEHHQLIGHAKDVAAGAVLIAAIGAVIIAGLVFAPYITG